MGGLFSRKKREPRESTQDKAIFRLKMLRDKLRQYQMGVEYSLEKDREITRTLLQEGKKERAKLLLRKKKYQEQLLQKTDRKIQNVDEVVYNLAFAIIEEQVIDGLKAGNEALRELNDLLNIEEVEKILEDTREGVEKQREIDEMLSGALTQQEEDDVLAELEYIIQSSLPEVPKEPVEKEVKKSPTTGRPLSARERRREQLEALYAA